MSNQPDYRKLILVPAIITLGVTIVRLMGELYGGPELLFGRQAGGGGALVGISWILIPFGIYFAISLSRSGFPAKSCGKLIGMAILSFILMMVIGAGAMILLASTPAAGLVITSLAAVGVMFLVKSSWPELFKTLVLYAFAARIPVAIIMFFAILGDWGTHYDAPPPEMEGMNWMAEWFLTGLIPQFTVWIATTAVIGGLFGGIAGLFVKSKQ